jgi:hypothetical protein
MVVYAVIIALKRLKQKDHEFKASLSTHWDPVYKKKFVILIHLIALLGLLPVSVVGKLDVALDLSSLCRETNIPTIILSEEVFWHLR